MYFSAFNFFSSAFSSFLVRFRVQGSDLHDEPDQGDCADPLGRHAQSGRREEGRNQLLHLANDQRLHEESHRRLAARGGPGRRRARNQTLLRGYKKIK